MAKRNKKSKQVKAAATKVKKVKPKPKLPHVQEALSTRWKMIIGALIAILAMTVYSPSHNYDLVYDDDAVLSRNRYVQQGIDGLDEIWSTSYFQGYDENMNARAFRPIPLTTLALEVELSDGINRQLHHTTNLIFYGLTGFFLFLLLAKLMRDYHPFLPIATCLIFVLHPIHLEVVANIKSRDTMLGFLGVCMAGWLLLKHLDNRKILPLLLSLIFYFIGLFSKEEVITTLAGLPLMLYFFRKYSILKISKTMVPYLAAVIIFLVYRSIIVGGINEGVTLTYLDNSLLAANGIGERISSQLLVLGHYLLKTVYPHPLISDYSYSTIPLVQWNDWRVYLSLIAILGLLYIGVKGLIERKVYGFGPLWYFSSVSIFSSIVVTNVSAYNDRFLYVPVLGIIFLLVYGLYYFVKSSNENKEPAKLFFKNNFIPVAIVSIIAAISIFKIESHLPVWQNHLTLFNHDVNIAPNNARMRKNYGGSFARLAVSKQTEDIQLARQYAQQALEQLNYALSIYDRMGTGHIHKGNMHIILGQNEEATKALERALEMAPTNYYAKSSLGNVYYRTGNFDKAIQIIESIPRHLLSASDIDVLARGYQRIGNDEKAAQVRSGNF
ncbi:MAG: tetratricopeptide repeat protein [Bacteroidota bacterium]